MIVFDAPVTPDALTTFVREVPFPSGTTLLDLFPTVNVATNTVDLSEITRTNRTARYRSFDGRIHVSDRDGLTDKKINMAPFSDSLNMGEYERLQLEFARTGGTRGEALENAIYNDAQRLTAHMLNRMNQALGQVASTGKFTVAENGLISEADFGVAASNKVTAATVWSTTATATALSDLVAWADVFEANGGGGRPAVAITDRGTIRELNRNKELIDAVKGAQTGATRVNLQDAEGVFADEGLPTRWIAVEDQVDVDGTPTRVWPAGKIAMLPADLGEVLEFRLGLSATALELVGSSEADMSFEEAPGIVGVVEKVGPPYRQFTFVDAVGMPILKDAKRILIATV